MSTQPEAVEAAYEEHPLIREIGVLSRDGQLVGVIVPELSEICQRGYREIAPAIREAIQERSKSLPSYQRLSDYAITRDALARTRLGKIRRHLLPDRYDQAKKSEKEPGELLQYFHVPVVPVFIHGTREALPIGQAIPRLKQITIVFGEPLNPGELEQQGQGKQPHERIVQALHNHVAELGIESQLECFRKNFEP